jgi:hypothetical protein
VRTVAVVFDPASIASVAAILEASAKEPDIAKTLLADARAIYWPKFRTGQDHQRAVLLAAIAAEVDVKRRLQDFASPELRPLVEIIVRNPRDVSQSVPQLLHKPLKAVTGQSLVESDKRLWDAVERLFIVRNRVAHRGDLPSETEGRAAVHCTERLFEWLDDLGH